MNPVGLSGAKTAMQMNWVENNIHAMCVAQKNQLPTSATTKCFTGHKTNPVGLSSAGSARKMNLAKQHLNAICVPRTWLKRRTAVVCGKTVIRKNVGLCAGTVRTPACLNTQQNAISVLKFCQKRRIAQECGTTVMTVSDALCAETAADLNAQQIIAKLVKRAEILIATKPQREVVVQTP